MRIVIASDSFKGSASSMEVANAIEHGIHRFDPLITCDKFSVADGGEGMVQALMLPAETLTEISVKGPMGKPTVAKYLIRKNTAIMEMAQASGLPLVDVSQRNPMLASTYGTGQMIADALDLGCTDILLGIGGSATNDGGTGMAYALGARFLNAQGIEVVPVGGNLGSITQVDMSGFDPRIASTTFRVACDVDNPLCGPQGASAIYGPQKGADQQMVGQLDANLQHLADIVAPALALEPGAGAAGGLGFGLMAFCNAKLSSGIGLVLDVIGIDDALDGADLVITGEGKIDGQSKRGKVPMGIAAHAARHGVPVVVLAGDIGPGTDALYPLGIDAILSTTSRAMPLAEAMANSLQLTEDAAHRMMRLLDVGRRMR